MRGVSKWVHSKFASQRGCKIANIHFVDFQ